jgi:hypothetical protein
MTDINEYLKAFAQKFKRTSEKDVEMWDMNWSYSLIHHFQDKITQEENETGIKLSEAQRRKFLDIMYKVFFVKGDYDERYDNVLVGSGFAKVMSKKAQLKSQIKKSRVPIFKDEKTKVALLRGNVGFDVNKETKVWD